MVISRYGRRFREIVRQIVWDVADDEFSTELLELEIAGHPPDRRRRDIDNILKPLLDALEASGLFCDDSQVMKILVEKCEPRAGGSVIVAVRAFGFTMKDGGVNGR